jgi:DNA anti-recombination protein RmuC
MEAVTELLKLDFPQLLLYAFVAIIGIREIVAAFDWLFERCGIEFRFLRNRNEDHALLIKTANGLDELRKKHEESVEQSILHDKEIKEDLQNYMTEMRQSVSSIQEKQEELIKTVDKMSESLENHKNATMETMCDRICEKTRRYINELHGIPEDEYQDFVRLYKSYEKINGNHGAAEKYNYCIHNLPILPVENKVQK